MSISLGSLQPSQASSALFKAVDGNAFRSRLEKHLDDHRAGLGHLSRPVYGEVEQRKEDTAAALGQYDPANSRLYAGYLTAGFTYDKEARFVSGVKSAADTARLVREA